MNNHTKALLFKIRYLTAIVLAFILFPYFSPTASGDTSGDIQALAKRLDKIIGPRDSVVISGYDNGILYEKNGDTMLVPASILKILTSLASIHELGGSYRFKTEFYQTPEGNLIIQGYGDPFLISERIKTLAEELVTYVDMFEDIILDASYFSKSIMIPGRGNSSEPYDAPNGALCVNFNTVHFKRQNGEWVSAEPQTPLLPAVIPKIRDSGLKSGRITMAGNSDESLQYAGEMFRYFFIQAGIKVKGSIRYGSVRPGIDKLIWTYNSVYTLTEMISDLLEYSNNFIANQLLLTMGANRLGPPATMEKGLKVLRDYCKTRLDIQNINLAEGSGLSRENLVNAKDMIKVLQEFRVYRYLMHHEGRWCYKTGTLSGVSTRAGYLAGTMGKDYKVVIILNTKGKNADDIMHVIESHLL